MQIKQCSKCKSEKSHSHFYKYQYKGKSKSKSYCKKCDNESNKIYLRTKEGCASQTYSHQKSHSRSRGHIPPTYTKKELMDWLFSQPLFHKLYDNWVESGYKRRLKPSVDRKDDFKGYTIDNIQLMEFRENEYKGHQDRKLGVSTQGVVCRPVNQFTKDGVFIAEYHSVSEAARKTTAHQGCISSCCSGRYNTAGGFKWRYA